MRVLDVFKLFRSSGVAPTPPVVVAPRTKIANVSIQTAQPESAQDPGTPRYPPIDAGIHVATPEEVLASQHDLIELLRRHLGLPDAEFQHKYIGPLKRAAALVNLLPATRDKHHTGAGGLFRFATTLAIRTAQSAEGRIFAASESIERRRNSENAWRHAAFLTGLTCELYRPLTEMLVFDPAGNQWAPFVAGLTQWAAQVKTDRFYIRWHQHDDPRSIANTLSAWAVNTVLGNEILAELSAANQKAVETIFGVASGAITTADNSTMAALLNEVRRKVIERDHQIAPTTYGKLTSGAHLEPYFVDAMRTLLRTGVWQVNARGARCHWGTDGFYVAWRLGAKELLGHLQKANIQGVPTSTETLAEMMGRAGIISVASDGSWVHMIYPTDARGGGALPAIRIQSPASILGHLEVKPQEFSLHSNVPRLPPVAAPESVADTAPVGQAVASTDTDTPTAPATPPQSTAAVPASAQAATATPELATPQPPPAQGVTSEFDFRPLEENSASKTVDAAPSPVASEGGTGKVPDRVSGKPAKATQPKTQRPKGGIPTVADVPDTAKDSFDKGLLVELGAPMCREIAAWRDKWNSGEAAEFLRTSEGLAISYAMVQSSAIEPAKITEALKAGAHLEVQVVGGKDRIMTSIPFQRKAQLGIVLRTNTARKAGFVLD